MRRPTHGIRAGARALAVVALVAAATAACGGGGDGAAAPATTTSPTPLPTATAAPEPTSGTCYRLTFADAVSPDADAPTAPCTKAHTSETYAVGRLDTIVHGHLLSVDSVRARSQVAGTCPDQLTAFLGGTRDQQRLTMVQSVYFTPSTAQADQGADWYRCDAVVLAGDADLDSVHGSLKGVLGDSDGRDRYAMCGTAEPGSSGFSKVLCSDPKASWKAIAVVDFDDGTYPGVADAKAKGRTPCQDAGRDASSDPLTYKWAYEWPTKNDWAAGQTFGRCWAPTSQ